MQWGKQRCRWGSRWEGLLSERCFLHFLIIVINKKEIMHRNYLTHQRKKLKNCDFEPYRDSVPTKCNSGIRNSLRNSFETANTFLSSGLSNLSYEYFPSKRTKDAVRESIDREDYKDSSSFLNTIKNISFKIKDARSLLEKSISPPKTNTSIDFQPSKTMRKYHYCSKQENQSKSTLNIESQQRFKGRENPQLKTNNHHEYYIKHFAKGTQSIQQKVEEHIQQSYDFLSGNVQLPENCVPLNLGFDKKDLNKKVLAIDMDQTLMYCQTQVKDACDFEIEIEEGEIGYVSIRPFALSFLKKVSQHFEIIVFTASERSYADAVLNEIDPEGLIKHRLYREHCVKLKKNLYSKDLRKINRDVSQIVLVDNCAASFLCQPENGIPILAYNGEKDDRELLDLERYLLGIVKEQDLREVNRKVFKFDEYKYFGSWEEVVSNLYTRGKSKTYY